MDILDSLFRSEKTYLASIQPLVQPTVNGVLGVKTYPVTNKTIPCLFWRGGISKSMISDKNKADISAAILLRPSDISVQEIPTTCRICIKDNSFNKYINKVTNYSAGALTIEIDGFDDSRKPIKKGDTFTIATETGSPEHTISAVILVNGITGSITFTPALASTVLNNAPVTITPVLGYYSIIYPDNIANQDQVIMLPVKEFI